MTGIFKNGLLNYGRNFTSGRTNGQGDLGYKNSKWSGILHHTMSAWDAIIASGELVKLEDEFCELPAETHLPHKDYNDTVGHIKSTAKVHMDARPYDLRSGALWSVDASVLTSEEVAAHISALTCVPHKGKKGGGFAGAAKPFPIGVVRDGRLYMPPHYAVQAFPGLEAGCGVTDGAPMAEAAVYKGVLWEVYPPQKQAVAAWAAWQPRGLPGIISLPCGHGKSHIVVAIAALHVRRVTVILVHKRPLVEQWREEIKAYVPGASVGIIIPELQVVEGVDYIVASLQCLHSHMQTPEAHSYLHALRRAAGFVVLDEAHHGVASTFQYVISRLPAAARLAVTATPRRQDKLFEELQFIFGPVIFRSFRRPGDGQAVMLRYNSPVLTEHKQWGRLRVDLMENDLVEDAGRDAAIVAVAALLAGRQERRVVVVTPRVAHVHTLRAKIQGALEAAGFGSSTGSGREVSIWHPCAAPPTRKRKGESDERHAERKLAAWQKWERTGPHGEWKTLPAPLVGVVTADMKTQAERQLNYEANVVVATSNMLEEGISYKHWDTLLDTDNSGDSEQIVGRIQRAGKKRVPLVVDMFSPVSLYVGLKVKRARFYEGERFGMHALQISSAADLPPPEWWEQFNKFTQSAL